MPLANPTRLVIGTLDDRRRVAELSANVHGLLGFQPAALIGSSLFDMIHPEDAVRLEFAFARVNSTINPVVEVRISDRHHMWKQVTVIVTVLEAEGRSRLAFVLAADNGWDASAELARIDQLEHHIQQIALEVQASGVILLATDSTADITPAGGALAPQDRTPEPPPLTADQLEILRLVGQGHSNHDIAAQVHVSTSTIKSHLNQIFRKLEVRSRVEAAIAATNAGWI